MRVWLLQEAEPLFFENGERSLRTGSLINKLDEKGHSVVWWTSRFDHSNKINRSQYQDFHGILEKSKVYFLGGKGYKKNISIKRILHLRSLAREFLNCSLNIESPDIIVASMPSPELCLAGYVYAKDKDIPFIVDIRDPWPDIFLGYFSSKYRFLLMPVIHYYRNIIKCITKGADGITAVSKSQLNWGIKYSGRLHDSKRDKVLYIGYKNNIKLRPSKKINNFTEENPMTCIYITSWGQSYDAETLIRMAEILYKKVGKRIKIVATGKGERLNEIKKEIHGPTNIVFTGWIPSEEMNTLLCQSHIGIIFMKGGITKYWIGNKISEYIATSLALLNNVGGEISYLIDENNIGINVPPNDPVSSADALISYLNSPSIIQTHMHNSRKLFEKSFNRNKISEDYIAYIKSIHKKKYDSNYE